MRRALHQLAYLITALLALLAAWALLNTACSAVFRTPDVVISPYGLATDATAAATSVPEGGQPAEEGRGSAAPGRGDGQQHVATANAPGGVLGTAQTGQFEVTVASARVAGGQTQVEFQISNRTNAPLDLNLKNLLSFAAEVPAEGNFTQLISYTSNDMLVSLTPLGFQAITVNLPISVSSKLTAILQAPNGERREIAFTVPS